MDEFFEDDDPLNITETFNSHLDIVHSWADNLLGVHHIFVDEDNTDGGVSEITLRAEDTGYLAATQVVEVRVYDGPQWTPFLEDELPVMVGHFEEGGTHSLMLTDFVIPATSGPRGEVTTDPTAPVDSAPGPAMYTSPTTSNPIVADVRLIDAADPPVEAAYTDGFSSNAVALEVTTKTVGKTTIALIVRQATGPGLDVDDATTTDVDETMYRFYQTNTIEFDLVVVR